MRVPPQYIAPRLAPLSQELLVRYVILSALLFTLSWLAQRPNTRYLRLGLVPPLYAAIWSFSGGIEYETQCFHFFTYIQGVCLCYLALLVPRLAFPFEPHTHSDPSLVGSTTIDLLTNPALILWNPTSYHSPPPSPPKEEIKSAREHAVAFLRNGALVSAISYAGYPVWKVYEKEDFPGVLGKIGEGAIVLIFGFCVSLFVDLVYQLSAAVSVGLLGWDEKCFPDTFDSPTKSTSIHEFWAKRWHSLLSPTFAFYSLPFPSFAQPLVVFFISGVLHDVGLIPLTGELDPWHINAFFTVQYVGVALESGWRKLTGKRVEGWGGFVWTWLWLGYTGRWVSRGWADRGVVGYAVESVFFWLR